MATTASGAFKATQTQYSPDNVMQFNQNRNYNNYNNNYNNNNTRARVERALDAEKQAAFQNIRHGDFAQIYEDSIGRPMPRIVEREISEMMEHGISSGLIGAVLEYTASAPRPSWAYARTVILRNYAKGINDEEEFNESIGGLKW